MVNKRSQNSSNYRTRSSLGITPKKRQSYGDFIEHPVAKKRVTSSLLATVHAKIVRYSNEVSPEIKRDLNSDSIVLKECFVKLKRLSEDLLDFPVESDAISFVTLVEKKCAVDGCTNGHIKNSEDDFYEFPEEINLKKQWLKLVKKKWVPGMAICSRHFEQNDFMTNTAGVKAVLKDGAIPKMCKLQRTPKTNDDETIENVIQELYTKKLVNKESYRALELFKDLTYREIEGWDSGGRVLEFVDVVGSLSREAHQFVKKAISLPDFERLPQATGFVDYTPAVLDLFPHLKNIDAVKTSIDLADVLVDLKLVLKGVRVLIENNAEFDLSILDKYEHEKSLKEKVETFSKIIFLNSPKTFHKIKEALHLPSVLVLFPSLVVGETDDVSLESLTLGQLMNEASKSHCIPEDSIRNLIPFGGCQLCPFSTSTLRMYSHVISAIFFNAPDLFNFLAQYLPLPNIVLYPKSVAGEECASSGPARKEDPQFEASPENQLVCGSPSSLSQNNETATQRKAVETLSDDPATRDKLDAFVRGTCPKTGKNVAKLDVDTEGFLPKDLTVKVVGHLLTINGCREENGQKVEFQKTVVLPNYVDADQAGCYYLKGMMSVQAPVLEGGDESDDRLSSSTNASSESPVEERNKVEVEPASEDRLTLNEEDGSTVAQPPGGKTSVQKSAATLPKLTLISNDDDIPRNVAVLMNVDDQEYVSLIVEVSKLFKPSEIIVKVRENKTISITGETRSSDPQTKSRLYAVIEREFDLPKKIERTSLKAGCSGDGLLKIFAKVASDQNGL